MKSTLKLALAESISKCSDMSAEDATKLLEQPKRAEHGDLAFPCFSFAKAWKCSPPECATKLASEISLPEGISEAVPTGPFLNFRFDRASFSRGVIANTLLTEEKKRSENIIVEYSSPNIAKPFHVGHLRTTLIGNCLDRVYRKLGYNTISINHLGDWGTQFGFVWAGCKLWGTPETPSVESLVELYKRATGLKEDQEKDSVPDADKDLPDVNDIARAYFLDLEEGKEEAKTFWEMCVAVSLEYLKAAYARLHISFDHYTGESFYSDKLDAVVEDLKAAGLLEESQGALGVDLGESLGFARIATPDGRSLYLTRDIAAAKYRAETYKFDRAVYVVGAPQTLHFQQIKAIFEKLGHDYADAIEHVAFGHVLGMKTRGEGGTIELNEFIDEAEARALEAYQNQVSKRPEGLDEKQVAKAVALSALIFSNLNRTNIKDVHFSWDHALAFQGDSGPYILYAYARINGIKEKAKEAGIVLDTSAQTPSFTEDTPYQLCVLLESFDAVLEKTVEDNEPSYLAAYALDLAKAFSKAYVELKVVGESPELAHKRLLLFEAVGQTLGSALRLLGIEPIERM